ncbi:hydrogenase maturation nickel metallochaperone HypA [haloarchaeon 3A1-DGR]|nr:hydrogenase maturation nickel metallochaperone HypA [haloarchaeon 3A1-DGR]
MGVPIGDAEGNHTALLECGNCSERYETDETMGNECPHCGMVSFEIVTGGDPDAWRPDGEVSA